jgi:hypothetical protein
VVSWPRTVLLVEEEEEEEADVPTVTLRWVIASSAVLALTVMQNGSKPTEGMNATGIETGTGIETVVEAEIRIEIEIGIAGGASTSVRTEQDGKVVTDLTVTIAVGAVDEAWILTRVMTEVVLTEMRDISAWWTGTSVVVQLPVTTMLRRASRVVQEVAVEVAIVVIRGVSAGTETTIMAGFGSRLDDPVPPEDSINTLSYWQVRDRQQHRHTQANNNIDFSNTQLLINCKFISTWRIRFM